ncbi:MAG: hypothetical protein GEV00_24055, partial [Actinophytocola sp.]|nr:hypothetical protein [Actinophytocola sp.]
MSGGIGGLFILWLGTTLWLSADLRDEWRKLDALDESVRKLAETSSAPAVLDGYRVLTEAATSIGHYPVHTQGTMGGSIAHADPSAEWCVLSLALGAELVV